MHFLAYPLEEFRPFRRSRDIGSTSQGTLPFSSPSFTLVCVGMRTFVLMCEMWTRTSCVLFRWLYFWFGKNRWLILWHSFYWFKVGGPSILVCLYQCGGIKLIIVVNTLILKIFRQSRQYLQYIIIEIFFERVFFMVELLIFIFSF